MFKFNSFKKLPPAAPATQAVPQLQQPPPAAPATQAVTQLQQPPPAAPATQAVTQLQQQQSDFLKSMQDMYNREAKNAAARQTQNLNAARLAAQQQSALAGYDPAMASRAMFEQTAGAYKSNQEVENALAQYGLDVEREKYGMAKETDERDYSRGKDLINMLQQGGYDTGADNALREFITSRLGGNVDFTHTPGYEKAAVGAGGEYDYYSNIIANPRQYSEGLVRAAQEWMRNYSNNDKLQEQATADANAIAQTNTLKSISDEVYGGDYSSYINLTPAQKLELQAILLADSKAVQGKKNIKADGGLGVENGVLYKREKIVETSGNKTVTRTVIVPIG